MFGFGLMAHLGCYFFKRYVEDEGCSIGMDVFTLFKGFEKGWVFTQVGKETQFYLRIVSS